jgi:FecR-like protein
MKTRITLIASLLLLSTYVAAQEPQSGTLNAPFAGATISDFKGRVSIQLPSHVLATPSRGLVLPAETLISTEGGGRMLLRLSDGSDLLVRPETRLLLKQPEAGAWRYVQMLVGRVRAEIQKRLSGASGFQIGTPSAVISVRGTKFDVEVNSSGITEVDVQEGVVQFDSARGMGESVLIHEGFSSRVGFESGPEAPRPTREMRPDLDRPGRIDDKHHDRDDDNDPVKHLRASNGDDHHDGDSRDSGGGSGSSSGGSSGSGSSGGSGGGDSGSGSGSSSGSDSHDSDGGHDSGDRTSGGHHPPEW